MLNKTKGIVINYLKYRESSLLVTIYTAEFGISSYVENGVRSAKAKHKIALFQPLTLLELEVYHKPGKGLHRISEAKCYYPYRKIPFDIAYSSIALFLTEVLGKVLREEEANPVLFDFLEDSFQVLDQGLGSMENFHLQFLWKLSEFLGFHAGRVQEFVGQLREAGVPGISDLDPGAVQALFDSDYGQVVGINRLQRAAILRALIYYYGLHIESFGELRSLQVLQEVMS
jgi:DNA repair protein RecO (recombination protein O)